VLLGATVFIAGCSKPAADPAAAARGQAMPVQTIVVKASPVPQSDTYVATIKSRRSATLTPQVDGNLTKILARSGDRVKAGQVLMVIDPLKQQFFFDAPATTEKQEDSRSVNTEQPEGRDDRWYFSPDDQCCRNKAESCSDEGSNEQDCG